MANRLYGTWRPAPPAPVHQDPARHRLWDSGPLTQQVFIEPRSAQRIVLTSPLGLQLHVTARPGRPGRFAVVPLLPAGIGRADIATVPRPFGISVPRDPARAAAAVNRRLIPDLVSAAALLPSRSEPRHATRIECAFGPDRLPYIAAAHADAVFQLLHSGRFELDPATGMFGVPDGVGTFDAALRARDATTALAATGFDVRIRAAAPHPPPAPQGLPHARTVRGVPSRAH
ncbi:hypothetical protein ACIBUY_04235 [Streptomyces sp. NPDC050085]|uniref:hypothetical protein n=1 Tax=Streptomyces sp. NPDC050085 TaxID=3365600 RepID=UPI0037B46B03